MSNATQAIRRLAEINLARPCNHTVEGLASGAAKVQMMADAARKIEELFDILHIDHLNDHNTRDTPARVAKMFVEEILRGRYDEPPKITEFENVDRYSTMIVTGPIDVRSTCAHHMMPIYGKAIIGILPSPDGKIIGLSKYDRIVDYFCARLQIQEELVNQIGNYIVDMTAPRGVAVRINAVHMCKTHRGVRASDSSRMISSAYFGDFENDQEIKREFLQEALALEKS
jgi:GTP cyclohydrolase IA